MKQIYIYVTLIICGSSFGWFAHEHYAKPKEVTKEIIRIDTVKVPPIIINKISAPTQLPQDKDEPTVYKYI